MFVNSPRLLQGNHSEFRKAPLFREPVRKSAFLLFGLPERLLITRRYIGILANF